MTFRRAGIVSPRGLTLIEVLIAVAILVAIGAIVAPNVLGQLDQRTFEAAIDRTSGHLLLARAHAQQTGRAVEVIYRNDPSILIARYFEANETADNNRRLPTRNNSDIRTPNAGQDDREVARSWARRTLPDPVILTRERPDFLDPGPMENNWQGEFGGQASAAADFADELPDFLNRNGEAGDEQSIRLAVFLSDGTAVFTRDLWITDQRERAASLRINTWTGDAIVTRPSRNVRSASAETAGRGREHPR